MLRFEKQFLFLIKAGFMQPKIPSVPVETGSPISLQPDDLTATNGETP